VKISELLEEDILKRGIEEIKKEEEMERLKEENKKMKEEVKRRDEENKEMKEEIKKRDEENAKLKEEIEILRLQLKETKTANDEKSYNKLFIFYFLFQFLVWKLLIIHTQKDSRCVETSSVSRLIGIIPQYI
jgi:seryl-tRNA synthetase